MNKLRVNDDIATSWRPSKYMGTCGHCGEKYYAGDKVNWNPRQKGTTCHAGCYARYGCPIPWNERNNVPKVHDVHEVNGTTEAINATKVNATEVHTHESKPTNTLAEQLAKAVEPYLDGRLKGMVTTEDVTAIVNKVLEGKIMKTVTTVTVQRDDSTYMDMGVQHKAFSDLYLTLQARLTDDTRLNVWLVGPAGTGKTTAARKCAEALGLPFKFTGSIDNEYKLLGFMDAQGRVVNTEFRDAWINGGVFLFDECDSSLANALLAFNAALANGTCAFPDGIYNRHKDCVIIAAANTWGLGATIEYVGRMKQDASFLDRFVQLEWDIDESLELATAPNEQWTKHVQKVRANVKAKSIKGVMITPRASYYGAALLATGMQWDKVERMTIRRAMTDDQWNGVK